MFGREPGYRPSGKHAREVVQLIEKEGYSQRQVGERLGISKASVSGIVKRHGERRIPRFPRRKAPNRVPRPPQRQRARAEMRVVSPPGCC